MDMHKIVQIGEVMSCIGVIGGREVRRRRVKWSVKWSLLIKSTEYAP